MQRGRSFDIGRAGLSGLLGLFYLFLYVPIVVLVIYSFNDSRVSTVWGGFTFEWYARLLENRDLHDALRNTVVVSLSATAAATVVGTLAALGTRERGLRWVPAFDGAMYLPIIVPEIVLGVGLLIFFVLIALPLSVVTVIIAHIVFDLPFVYIVVRARLAGMDMTLEEAAQDLGANRWQTFRHVTLPQIAPGVLAGALLALTISVDDFVVSFFTAGIGATTLPIYIFGLIRLGITPEINAISSLLLAVSLALVAVSLVTRRGS